MALARKEQEGMAAGDMDTNIEEGEHDHQFAAVRVEMSRICERVCV